MGQHPKDLTNQEIINRIIDRECRIFICDQIIGKHKFKLNQEQLNFFKDVIAGKANPLTLGNKALKKGSFKLHLICKEIHDVLQRGANSSSGFAYELLRQVGDF